MFKSLLLVSCCAVAVLARPQEENKPEDTIKRMERQIGDMMGQMNTNFPSEIGNGVAIAKEFQKMGEEMAEIGLAMMSGATRSARSAQKPGQGPPRQPPPNNAPPHANFRRLVRAV